MRAVPTSFIFRPSGPPRAASWIHFIFQRSINAQEIEINRDDHDHDHPIEGRKSGTMVASCLLHSQGREAGITYCHEIEHRASTKQSSKHSQAWLDLID